MINSIFFKIFFFIFIFSISTYWIFYLGKEASKILESEAFKLENENLKFPSDLEELKKLSLLLKENYTKHYRFIFILFSSAYLYKQAFAIPGSVFLNLLAGSLFGLYYGLVICCTLCTLGALSCFFLSKFCGEILVKKFFPLKLIEIRKITEKQNSYSLFSYLLSIRLFPVTPNWLINIICPLVGVPWYLFALSVYIGLIPYIYLCVQTGEILTELTSTNDLFSLSIIFKSSLIAILALSPTLYTKFFSKKKTLKKNKSN